MILFDTTRLIPREYGRSYRAARLLLAAAFISSGFLFTYRAFFPSQEFLFSFETPETSKNTLENPIGTSGEDLRKGKLPEGTALRTYAGTIGSFSKVTIRLVLENDSPVPREAPSASLRKSYRSFFFPEGEPVPSPTKDRAFLVEGTPFLFSEGIMIPFISDAAALSRFPKESFTNATRELLATFPPVEEPIGFRPGSLLSDAEGVYAIGGDMKAHPIGNTSVFESLGFSWDDVLPVSAEELQFHKRGKIYLYDAAQPEGTVFIDRDNGKISIVEGEKKRPVTDPDTIEILRKRSTPVSVSESALDSPVGCTLTRKIPAFRPTYECTVPIRSLARFPGKSFEITINAPQAIHAAVLSATFEAEPGRENFSVFLSQIGERFEAIYGKR